MGLNATKMNSDRLSWAHDPLSALSYTARKGSGAFFEQHLSSHSHRASARPRTNKALDGVPNRRKPHAGGAYGAPRTSRRAERCPGPLGPRAVLAASPGPRAAPAPRTRPRQGPGPALATPHST